MPISKFLLKQNGYAKTKITLIPRIDLALSYITLIRRKFPVNSLFLMSNKGRLQGELVSDFVGVESFSGFSLRAIQSSEDK